MYIKTYDINTLINIIRHCGKINTVFLKQMHNKKFNGILMNFGQLKEN